jgi:type II secretory pathway pseudopilin PulG
MIELVVALAIFGITIVGFVGNLLSNVRNTRLSEEISDATAFAQDELDAEPTTSGGPATSANNPILSRTWTVTPNTPVNGARTVSVTVSWRDAGNRSITLQSILTPH